VLPALLNGCAEPPPGMIRVDDGPGPLAPFYADRALAQEGGAPLVGLTWDEAQARCAARGLRLPTDGEWQALLEHAPEVESLHGALFQWTATRWEPPPESAVLPELRGERRVVRGSCCPWMPAWSAPDHRAAFARSRGSRWLGFRCAGPVAEDLNLALDAPPPPATVDEGEAIRQLLSDLWGPGRAPTDPAVADLITALPRGAGVADVGCGLGALAIELARAVGPEGTVYAVDIDPEVLAFARAVAREAGAHAVQPVQATPTALGLPAGCCQLVLLYDMANSLQPGEVAAFSASAAAALAPGGRLAVYHTPGPTPPTAVLDALSERGLEQELLLRDPLRGATPGGEAPAKLWVFGKP
jgi:SAM-dependent methyltransferase